MDNGMENRSKTVAIVIAILLVVVLVWFLFIRGSGDEETTTPAPVTTEPAAPDTLPVGDQGESGGDETGTTTNGGDETTGDGSETPPGDETPGTGEDAGSDETVTLPDNWSELSLAQKLALNPYSCDLDTYPQSMWPDGTCHPPADATNSDDDESNGEEPAADPMGDDKKEAEPTSNEDEAGQS